MVVAHMIPNQNVSIMIMRCRDTQRCASGAAESGSAADAVSRRLHAIVRGFGGGAATHVAGTGQPVRFLLSSWEDRGSS
jgi:hypothetical protein